MEGSGPGCADIADIGGSGATEVDDECDTDVEKDDDDVIEPDPMEQLLLLLVQGAIELGGIEPRLIIPSGGAMGWWDPMPWGGIIPGPPPLRCIG